jgi:hypothetical protein
MQLVTLDSEKNEDRNGKIMVAVVVVVLLLLSTL